MPSSALLVLLFAGSGAAALIYEVVWQQLLQLVIGSSTVSLGVLLGAYMGGMCLGSLFAPRLIDRQRHPLRVYAALEVAIGIAGVVLLWAMPAVTRAYVAAGGIGPLGVLVRGLIAAICLVPPTFAMGATLPVVARWVEDTPAGRAWLGWFYAGNLAGAVAGCLGAGFYLLRVFDMAVTSYVAVALNLLVAAGAWAMSRVTPMVLTTDDGGNRSVRDVDAVVARVQTVRTGGASTYADALLLSVAISGFCALSAEVVWTRLLALNFGATVYTFSIILGVFLVGLGLGSTAGAAIGHRVRRAEQAFGWCQLAAVAGMAWSAYALSHVLPYWSSTAASSGNIWAMFREDLLRATLAILPAPIMWGGSFALALAATSTGSRDGGAVVGRVYAANTVGAIAGALLTSLVLVPRLGSQHAQQVMQLTGVCAAALVLWRALAPESRVVARTGVLASLAFVFVVPPVPGILVAYGRHSANWARQPGNIIYVGEGMHASIAISKTEEGHLNYHNAGKIQASSQPQDMRLQRMLGHLTTLVPSSARSVLVIGCGAGVTAGAVSVSPSVERVTIVDIEPLVPRVAGQFMGPVNHDVIRNPKVHVIADDARHFLQTTTEKFDAITSDPLDPWVKGAATLYTQEFFEIAKRHLKPGGVMTLYVQLFESSPEAVKSEVATFFSAFPEGLMFGNQFEGHAIDTVLLGQVEKPQIWVDELESMLRSPAFAGVDSSLVQAGLYGAVDLFGNYAGRASDLKGWLADAQINHDLDLRLQYLAGLGLNLHDGDAIYRDVLSVSHVSRGPVRCLGEYSRQTEGSDGRNEGVIGVTPDGAKPTMAAGMSASRVTTRREHSRVRPAHRCGSGLRGLLTVLALTLAAGAACRKAPEPAQETPASHDAHIVARSGLAMGSSLTLMAWASDEDATNRAFDAVFAEFDRLDHLMSVWKEGSDVLRLNAAAGDHPVPVSPETMEALVTAHQISEWTHGKFDVTFGALTDVWKFDHDQDNTVPSAAAIAARLPLIDYRRLVIDQPAGTAFLQTKGMRVHLGGIGKGYAVERAEGILRKAGLVNFSIQAGGDLYVAGRRGDRPWRLGIADPRNPDGEIFARVELSDSTFSTSGDYERFFIKDGVRYHHIIDPATGQPATRSRSVTVVTKRPVIADGISKGIFLLGPEGGLALAAQVPDVEVVIVGADNHVYMSPGLKGRVEIVHPPTDGL
ncbi:MAG: fused MFS/spermidine synthase [Vicinamibacterales bacterium]